MVHTGIISNMRSHNDLIDIASGIQPTPQDLTPGERIAISDILKGDD